MTNFSSLAPLYIAFTDILIPVPINGIIAKQDNMPSNHLPRIKYIRAFITSTISPYTGINPTQSNMVCIVSMTLLDSPAFSSASGSTIPRAARFAGSSINVGFPVLSVIIPTLYPVAFVHPSGSFHSCMLLSLVISYPKVLLCTVLNTVLSL